MTRWTSALCVPLLAACGAALPHPAVPSEHEVVTLEEMRIVARRDAGELVFDSYDAGELFARGTELLNRGQCRDAVEQYYSRIPREFPSSRYVGAALYNSGYCLQTGGEPEAAVEHYQALLERLPNSRDARHAALQLALVFVLLERWDEGLALVDQTLLREDLEAPERLEALARRAQTLLGLERVQDAERQARDALSYYRMQDRTGQIPEPYFAAAANFVLAESMRTRSEAMRLPAGTAQEQHAVLDRRARLVLDAQREYFNTIRHTNAEWASAAGYRIGSMYDRLWSALMEAPIPPPSTELAEEALPVYRREYRQELSRHIRPLLRHAIRYWELTLLMAERTGVRSEWADRTREELEQMRTRLLEETDPSSDEAPREEPEATDGSDESAALHLPRSLRGTPDDLAAEAALVTVVAPPARPNHAESFAVFRVPGDGTDLP